MVRIPEVKCIEETKKGILCRFGEREEWIPISQLDDDSEVAGEGDEGVLIIPLWLASEKSLLTPM